MSGTGADGPVEGAKGEADQLIITLGSAAVFGALLGCLRVWLGRDRDRRINVRYQRSSISGGAAATTLTIKEGVRHEKMRRISSSDPAHLVQT
jgi:hypothetical protein